MKILISSCLLGDNVKYSGGNNFNQNLIDLLEKYDFEIIKVCPEVMGGLSTPRTPAEIIKNKVITKIGEDDKVDLVILKENSPSCGVNKIYDGTFSNILIEGRGLTAEKLFSEEIKIFSEKELDKIEKFLKSNLKEK